MKKKILVVDDDSNVREYMKLMFEYYNYTVDQSDNILDAEIKVYDNDIDLIILDVMMEKDSDGFTLAQILKSDVMYKHIPIVMVTGVNQKTPFKFDINTDGNFLPVEAFMEKPVIPEKLVSVVEDLLN